MAKFTTCKDRVMRATGEDSNVDWGNLGADTAQYILDGIKNGTLSPTGHSYDEHTTPTTTANPEYTITIAGKTLALNTILNITNTALRLAMLVALCVIAARTCCNCQH